MGITRPAGALVAMAVMATAPGCVSAPEPTAVFASTVPAPVLAQQISAAARRCWGRGQANLNDAVVIEDGAAGGTLLVTGRRSGRGVSAQEPFIKVAVGEQGGGSRVEVQEGEFTINTRLDLTADVRRWAAGDLTCR